MSLFTIIYYYYYYFFLIILRTRAKQNQTMRMTATKINGLKQKVSNFFFFFFFFGKIEQNKTQSERVKIDKTKDATKMISGDKRNEGKSLL